MGKKLKIKFIGIVMGSLLLIIALLLGVVNALTYRSFLKDTDETLDMLIENGGKFPGPSGNIRPQPTLPIYSPEEPFRTRFFWVLFSEDGKIIDTDISNIAAVNEAEAEEYAMRVLKFGKGRGFVDGYRFAVSEGEVMMIVFLDFSGKSELLNTVRYFSVGMSLALLGCIFALLIILADRILKPITDSYEKQRKFITNAGHDIKTPITVIEADAALALLDSPESEWIIDIQKQTRRLASLTQNLIYLSKMEEEPKLSKYDFPLSDLIEEELQSFRAVATGEEKAVNAKIEPGVFIYADEGAVRRLVTILLDNALKYSETGETVELSLTKSAWWTTLRISNPAGNLSEESVEHMFDRFYRADHSRSSGGFGIGLSVAAAIVSAHKGKIYAKKNGERIFITVNLPFGK